MKIYAAYGFASTLAATALTFVAYLLGFHSDPAKIGTAQLGLFVVMCAVSATCITLGTRARRASVPLDEDFGYGRALGAGVMISLFAGLFGIATNYLYTQHINPGFADVLIEAETAKWEARGMSSQHIENAEKMMRRMFHPAMQAVSAFIGSAIIGTLISLVTAAFLKRPAFDPLMPPALRR